MDVIHFGEDTISGEDISMEEKIEFIDNMTSDQFDIIKNSLRLCQVVENEINFDCRIAEPQIKFTWMVIWIFSHKPLPWKHAEFFQI